VIKNKSMGGERDRYDRLRQTMRVMRQTKVTQTNKTTQDNNETEIDHKRALDKLQGLREGKIYNMIDETKQPTAAGSPGTGTSGGSPSGELSTVIALYVLLMYGRHTPSTTYYN
jgi:hypothetical protein